MSNAWYISPPTEEACKWIQKDEGVVPPPIRPDAVGPTPQQVFDAVQSFPEYRVTIKRGTYKHPRKGEQHDIDIALRSQDDKYGVEVAL